MGSNQFQREYIQYLEDRNTELLNKLTHMKENYENKIFSKDLSKHYLVSALEDILASCTALPQEIDLFFDKITAAMDIFKNILLRKSEMVQLVDKITRIMNPEKLNAEVMSEGISNFVDEQNTQAKGACKGGPVKVSPMINGHVISTTPRIYLSRISRDLSPEKRSVSHQLSPIVEASPDTSSDIGKLIHQELRIPLERLNLNKLSLNEDSPKSRFKGPKTWKKSLASKKQQMDTPKSPVLIEDHSENVEVGQLKTLKKDSDPLEGPSWLYDSKSSPLGNRSCFIDFKRRKHRFATAFDMNNCFEVIDSSEDKPSTLTPNKTDKLNKSIPKSKRSTPRSSSKEINETSEDFICGSFNKDEENNSSFERKLNVSDRKCIEESSADNETPQCDTVERKKVFRSSSKRKSQGNSPVKSDSSYEADNEENLSAKKFVNKSYSKRRTRSTFHEVSMDITPVTKSTPESDYKQSPAFEKKESKNSKSKVNERSLKKEKSIEQDSCEKLVKCLVARELSKKSKSEKESLQKGDVSRLKSEPSTPNGIPSEIEGRKKRKAAPTNLSEPSLITKLRRN